MNISKEASSTLMIANLIAMILVIAIHYNSQGAINASLKHDWNYIFQEILINGFARSAVPFFAMISGYFIVNKIGSLDEYYKTLKNKFKTLFIPYIVASAFIFVVSTAHGSLFKPEITVRLDLYSIVRNVLGHPASGQFWFLRDIIILVIISPILFNVKNEISYFIGLLLALLWFINIQPFPIRAGWPLLNIETLFFFWIGGVLSRFGGIIDHLIGCGNTIMLALLIAWVGLIALRVCIDPAPHIYYANIYTRKSVLLYKVAIILGIICLIQVSALMKNNSFLIYLSGMTFFVFLFHLVPLEYFRLLTRRVVDAPYSFFMDFPVATVLVFFFGHILSSKFSKAYDLMTGGRNPIKAMQRIR